MPWIPQAGEVNWAESLFDLGVDSMLALDLRNRLKRSIGATVSLATLMGDITGDGLSRNLEDADERHTPHRKWTFRVTNTADIGAARLATRSD